MTDEFFKNAAADYNFDGIIAAVTAGADPDTKLKSHGTLLIYAVCQGQQGLAESLVRAGANIDLADKDGGTPLMHAAGYALHDMVESLLEAGADPLAVNANGKTARGAAYMASKSLEEEFNDGSMRSTTDLQVEASRLARIAKILEEAEGRRAKENEIKAREEAQREKDKAVSDCHDGLCQNISVGQPLKLKTPGT